MRGEKLKVTIRPMTPDDLEAVLPIEAASYAMAWSRPMFEAELLGNPFASLFVAEEPDQKNLVAYVCFWVVFEELHLMNLTVHPDRRRMGIGEELSRWMQSRAKERGARTATLEVRASNEAARRLYEKLGFKVAAIRRGYYRDPREDALIMTAELP